MLGCDSIEDERAAWLRSALTAEHRLLRLRTPEQLAAKYARMAAHPYDYLRGTLPLWVQDTLAPGGRGLAPTVFVAPELARMLLVGDPHPENVGTYLSSSQRAATHDEILIELNDFDAATFGPPIHDLRRLATSLRLLAVPVIEPTDAALDAAVAAMVEGYRGALFSEPAPRGRIIDDLVRRAIEDRLEALDWSGDEYAEPTDEQHRFVAALLTSWPGSCVSTCPPAKLVRLVRRLGQGVASVPLWRFYAVIEGDLVLDIKEAREATVLPLPAATLPFSAEHNAARIVMAQRALQSSPTVDPLLGFGHLPDDPRTSFRVAERAPSQKGISRTRITERLADGRWSTADLHTLAGALGHLLGAAHTRAWVGPDDPRPAGPALAALYQRLDPDALTDELVAWSSRMALEVVADHRRFVDLLTRHGPLLEP